VSARGTLLFHRRVEGPSGGHLKMWHYFEHSRLSTRYSPRVYFDGPVVPGTPWSGQQGESEWEPREAAALVVGGLDWRSVPEDLDVPVLNVVQSVRHSLGDDERRSFLRRRAVRLCSSHEVAEAILATGEVNGPVHVVPAGLDPLSAPAQVRDIEVLVVGVKEPAMARQMEAVLSGAGVKPMTLTSMVPRDELLSLMGRSHTVVTIPYSAEGAYLPPLEAMAMGALVVCPRAPGMGDACRDGQTCLAPHRTAEAISDAVLYAARMSDDERQVMVEAGRAEAGRRPLEDERRAVLDLLARLEQEHRG